MENTIENKQKFQLLYFGQKVAAERMVKGTCVLDFSYIDNCGMPDYLLLTPLSSISDEDAIAVAKMVNSYNENLYDASELKDMQILDGNEFLGNLEEDEYYFFGAVEITDYLRSRGYALPWMNLSVDKLISRGWVKLKTK